MAFDNINQYFFKLRKVYFAVSHNVKSLKQRKLGRHALDSHIQQTDKTLSLVSNLLNVGMSKAESARFQSNIFCEAVQKHTELTIDSVFCCHTQNFVSSQVINVTTQVISTLANRQRILAQLNCCNNTNQEMFRCCKIGFNKRLE